MQVMFSQLTLLVLSFVQARFHERTPQNIPVSLETPMCSDRNLILLRVLTLMVTKQWPGLSFIVLELVLHLVRMYIPIISDSRYSYWEASQRTNLCGPAYHG